MRVTVIFLQAFIFVGLYVSLVQSFSVIQTQPRHNGVNTCNGRASIAPLSMAGFGGGGGSSKKKGGNKKNKSKAKPLNVKPKSQWDKYKSLKEATSVKVAARAVTEGNDGEWYEVGKVKSEEDKLTELAVFMQRGIITSHAKRMYPLQFLPKDQAEWAYAEKGDDDDADVVWIAVDTKNVAEAATPGMEKKVGFQGNPESTGFYSSSLVGSNGPVIVI
mmetsp:Transcript_12275/g.17900  ORF Transcript_12275/g.17900 Transcript_12275/m.17900 type:complete len:218 (-) Transcript_12275:188-841(-)